MRTALTMVILVTLAGCGRPAPPPAPAPAIRLTSSAIAPGGRINPRQSAHGDNLSPPLNWTAVPGAETYAIVMEDPDAPGRTPFVHWLAWNIPAGVTSLAEGEDAGVQGGNDNGQLGYFGPAPPSGTHHYRLKIFALDTTLPLGRGEKKDALDRAMDVHVLARGELDGTFAAPSN